MIVVMIIRASLPSGYSNGRSEYRYLVQLAVGFGPWSCACNPGGTNPAAGTAAQLIHSEANA